MRVYIDFDNTVTLKDVLSQLIERFSINDDWKALEDAWELGEISAKECLIGQMKGVRIYQGELGEYLKTIEIDPYFVKLVDFLKEKGIEFSIVSDNFESMIRTILDYSDIKGVPVYANHLRIFRNRLFPSFPYENPDCGLCAHCKKVHFMQDPHSMEDPIIYVGDGQSDICPARDADIVLAKGRLLKYFKKHKLSCIEFNDLNGVYEYLKEGLMAWCPSDQKALKCY